MIHIRNHTEVGKDVVDVKLSVRVKVRDIAFANPPQVWFLNGGDKVARKPVEIVQSNPQGEPIDVKRVDYPNDVFNVELISQSAKSFKYEIAPTSLEDSIADSEIVFHVESGNRKSRIRMPVRVINSIGNSKARSSGREK